MDERQKFIWNFPLDITFRSTCPFGWPQIVISVYEIDAFGNETICGYGSVHLPLSPGPHAAKVPIFAPQSSSLMQRFASYFLGRKPEYVDPRVTASGEGRDVTRVRSCGWVRLTFNIMTKDLKRLGYETKPKGAVKGIKNSGPGEGVGLVSKTGNETGTLRKSDRKIVNRDIEEEQSEDEDDIVLSGSQIEEVQ